jgi:hypothetical protein
MRDDEVAAHGHYLKDIKMIILTYFRHTITEIISLNSVNRGIYKVITVLSGMS